MISGPAGVSMVSVAPIPARGGKPNATGGGTATPTPTPTPTPGPSPSIAFALPTAAVLEGNGGATTVSNAINVVRNGATGALVVNLTYGGTAAGGVDYATAPVSVTIGAEQSSASFDVLVNGDAGVEPDETIVITAVLAAYPSANATKTITVANDDAVAAPSELLLGSRFNQMGFNGYAGSDGTDTDSNSRIGSYNETGTSVTKLRAYFANWMANNVSEQDGVNAITVKAAIEFPAGTFTPLAFGGSATAAIPASGSGNLAESDEVTLTTPIPAGAQYWVRTWVSVSAGQKWPQGYAIATPLGEAADFSTGVDKTTSGTITNATASANRRGYGPVALKATGFTGAPVAKAFAVVGDSLVMGSGDVLDGITTGRGNIGYPAKAFAANYPAINLGIAGTAVRDQLSANFARRGALLSKIGLTHIFMDWGINDLAGSQTLAQVTGNLSAVAGQMKGYVPGAKVIQTTITPYTTGTYLTAAGQAARATPAGVFTGGVGSVRAQVNAAIRAGLSNIDYVFDAADAVEVDDGNSLTRNGGKWISGNGGVGASNTHLTTTGAASDGATNDGLHPIVTNTAAPGLGGIYILRDAVRAVMGAW